MTDLIDQFALPQSHPANPLDDYWAEKDRNAASAAMLMRSNPEQAGRANVLSRQFGLPADTVERNLGSLEDQAAVRRARGIMERYPAVGAWASEPRNAAISKDDLDNLEKNARYWARATSGSIRATPTPEPTVGNFLSGIGTSFVESARQMWQGTRAIAADYLPSTAPRSAPGVPRLGDFGFDNAIRDYQRSTARVDDSTPTFKSWWARDLYSGTSSLAQMAPGIAAGIATGGVAPVVAIAGIQQGLPSYAKYRERGGSQRAKPLRARALEGGAEAAGELLPWVSSSTSSASSA
jgi:hypothetical protein